MFSLGVMTLVFEEPERDPIEVFDEMEPGVFHLSLLSDDSEIIEEPTSVDDLNCCSLPPVLTNSSRVLVINVLFLDESEEIRCLELDDLPGL